MIIANWAASGFHLDQVWASQRTDQRFEEDREQLSERGRHSVVARLLEAIEVSERSVSRQGACLVIVTDENIDERPEALEVGIIATA